MPSQLRPIERGPRDARVIIVGEAPGEEEIARGQPFVGPSGYELERMLREAGHDPAPIFYTNVAHERPPSYQNKQGKWVHNEIGQFFVGVQAARRSDISLLNGRYPLEPVRHGLRHLQDLLSRRKPSLIIATGNTPLWGLVGQDGITKWRGSIFDTSHGKVLATFHPADVLRRWEHRPVVVQDLRRALRESQYPEVRRDPWNFVIDPTFEDIRAWFADTDPSTPLVCDTEGWGRVDCIGFARSRYDAICIPFTSPERVDYYDPETELEIVLFIKHILQTRDIIFHNGLWDCQVIARTWGFLPRFRHDTQVAWHVLYPGMIGGKIDPITGRVGKEGSSLSLSFVASILCENYRFWKDDGRQYDPVVHSFDQYQNYNCEDCVRTFEVFEHEQSILDKLGMRTQYEHEMRLFAPVFKMMFRGVGIDVERMRSLRRKADHEKDELRAWLSEATGIANFNPNSPKQTKALFYDDLRLPKHYKGRGAARTETLDDKALESISRSAPWLYPVIRRIQHYRSVDTIKDQLNTDALSSTDARLRCAINVAFVETMRFSTNETAFGEGFNMQNLLRPPEKD